jgi:hypothetical protein
MVSRLAIDGDGSAGLVRRLLYFLLAPQTPMSISAAPAAWAKPKLSLRNVTPAATETTVERLEKTDDWLAFSLLKLKLTKKNATTEDKPPKYIIGGSTGSALCIKPGAPFRKASMPNTIMPDTIMAKVVSIGTKCLLDLRENTL